MSDRLLVSCKPSLVSVLNNSILACRIKLPHRRSLLCVISKLRSALATINSAVLALFPVSHLEGKVLQ
jgi:hypothetical protein